MEKNKRLLLNTLIFMIGNIGAKVIQFFLVPLYTYTMSTQEFGITELVFTAMNLLMPVFSFSISDGLLRYGLDKNNNRESVIKISLLIVSAGTIVSLMLTPIFMLNGILKQWIIYFLAILNLRIYRDVFSIILKIDEKNKLFMVDSILYTLELCLLSIYFLDRCGMGVEGYFLAYVMANVFSIAFLLISGKAFKGIITASIEKKLLKEIVIYSIPMVFNGVAWWITNAADRYMIGYMMNESAVGLYSVSAKIPSLITTFLSVFAQAWIISAVIEYDSEKEKKFYSETFNNYYLLLVFGTSILLSIIRIFMKVYVQADYYEAWRYATFLVSSITFSGIAGFLVGVYSATKKNMDVMVTTILGAVVNVILNFVLIPKIGIQGASIATYISWMIIALVRLVNLKKIFDFYINYKKIIIYSTLVLLQSVLVTYTFYIGYIFSLFVLGVLMILEKDWLRNTIFNFIKRKVNK